MTIGVLVAPDHRARPRRARRRDRRASCRSTSRSSASRARPDPLLRREPAPSSRTTARSPSASPTTTRAWSPSRSTCCATTRRSRAYPQAARATRASSPGLRTAAGKAKPALTRLPPAAGRRAPRAREVSLWGLVRPAPRRDAGHASRSRPTGAPGRDLCARCTTDARGYFRRTAYRVSGRRWRLDVDRARRHGRSTARDPRLRAPHAGVACPARWRSSSGSCGTARPSRTTRRPDAERRLTERGEAQARAAGRALAAPRASSSTCASRARRSARRDTAVLACARARRSSRSSTSRWPRASTRREALELLAAAGADQRMLVVGHEPDFSQVVYDLTGGRIDLKKGGVAGVRLAAARASSCVLHAPARARSRISSPVQGLERRSRGDQDRVVDAGERRRVGEVERARARRRVIPVQTARREHVDALGRALDADDLRAEQAPVAGARRRA